MKQSPAFQFYPNDFMASGKVGTMTTEEIGMYVLLLCLDWNETGFEFDERRLARWCRVSVAKFRRDWQNVSSCFIERDGRMFNPRLELEREKQAEWREKSSRGGKASAKVRAKGGSRVVEPQGQPNGNTPSPSSKKDGKGTNNSETNIAPAPKRGASWVAAVVDLWTREAGNVSPGRVGKELKPHYERVGLEPLLSGIRYYLRLCKAQNKPPVWAFFTGSVSVWVEKAAAALSPVNGELSGELDTLTAPLKLVRPVA